MKMLQAGVANHSYQSGFSYLIVLVALVIMAILAEGAVGISSYVMKKENEKALMFRGMAYQTALRSYYNAGLGKKVYPASLDELLDDSRFSHRKHIRKLYPDPMTDKPWGIIRDSYGNITGVFSQSEDMPAQRSNFPPEFSSFENADSYSGWTFLAL